MAEDFLSKLLGNTARTRLLRVFAFNPTDPYTVAQLTKRAGISSKTAARELKVLESLRIIKKGKKALVVAKRGKGKKREPTWLLNTEFKHATAITKFVHEVSPVEYKSFVNALKSSGRVTAIVLSGTFMGDPTRPADLLVVADSLNEGRLERAIRVLEPQYGREIRYAAFQTPEFRYRLTVQDRLIRDTLDFPHLVLLDKTRLL